MATDATIPSGSSEPAESERRATQPAAGILQLAWPAIVGNLLMSTVGLVDIKIVGSLGPSAVAAVTTGNRMFFVLQGVLMAVTAGTTALVARARGAATRSRRRSTRRSRRWSAGPSRRRPRTRRGSPSAARG